MSALGRKCKARQPESMVGVAQNVPFSIPMGNAQSGGDRGAATGTDYFYVWHSLDAWHTGRYDPNFERRPSHRNSLPVGQFLVSPLRHGRRRWTSWVSITTGRGGSSKARWLR